jgi:hypothetical protein
LLERKLLHAAFDDAGLEGYDASLSTTMKLWLFVANLI